MISIRNKSKFYKRVLVDVWGQHVKSKKLTKFIHFKRIMREQYRARKAFYRNEFVYSLAKKINFRRKKRHKQRYIKPKVLYNYYLILRRRAYRKYLYKAKKKYGFFYDNFLTYIEGRLFMLVYRANFITNMFKIQYAITKGLFLVNGIKRYHGNFNVNIGEIVQLDFKYKSLVTIDMKMRLEEQVIVLPPRSYLFMNYKFMFIFFVRAPKKYELDGNPIKLDPYIGADLYYLDS